MHYEINVSLNGQHFFATHARSLTRSSQMVRVYETFLEKFPKSQGFEVEVTRWDCTGTTVTPKEINL